MKIAKLASVIALLIIVLSCVNNNEPNEQEEQINLSDCAVVVLDTTAETDDVDLMAIFRNGSHILYDADHNNGYGVIYCGEDINGEITDNDLTIIVAPDGAPRAVSCQGNTLVFDKISGRKADLTIIEKDKDPIHCYDIELPEEWAGEEAETKSDVKNQDSGTSVPVLPIPDTDKLVYRAKLAYLMKVLSYTMSTAGVYLWPQGAIPYVTSMVGEWIKSEYGYNSVEYQKYSNDILVQIISFLGRITSIEGIPAENLNKAADDTFNTLAPGYLEYTDESFWDYFVKLSPDDEHSTGTMNEITLTCGPSAGRYTVNLDTKSSYELKYEDQGWFRPVDNFVYGQYKIDIYVGDNTTGSNREGYIRIEAQGRSETATASRFRGIIKVIQHPKSYIRLSTSSVSFPPEGGTQTIKIVDIGDDVKRWDTYKVPEWCIVKPNKDSTAFTITVGKNEELEEKTGYFLVVVANKNKQINDVYHSVSVQQDADEEGLLRKKLIQFYKDTDGPNWVRNDNWCSALPLEEWYGISFDAQGYMRIDLSGNNLTHGGSLNGIEILKHIDVRSYWGNNYLEYLDVSDCTALEKVICYSNCLEHLDVSGCSALNELVCYDNKLVRLNLSGCSSLVNLDCSQNLLPSIDVSSCSSLEKLECGKNKITSLNVSSCSSLQFLGCGENQLTSLSIANLAFLVTVACDQNPMTVLEVTGCPSLTSVAHGYSMFLKTVNVSRCTALTKVVFTKNVYYLDQWSWQMSLGYYGDSLESLDVSGCTGLEYLEIDSNPNCSSVNVTGCSSLKRISVNGCRKMTDLDVSGLLTLNELNCADNTLTSLNVSGCPSLEIIDCFSNHITSIDISGCPSLYRLWCNDNHIIQQITNEDKLSTFIYDYRYSYQKSWDPAQGRYITTYIENPYGWYYPGEPEKGYHGRD